MKQENSIEQGIELCLQKNRIFAAYRLPGTYDKYLLIQENHASVPLVSISDAFVERGFLICPFHTAKEKIFFIRADYHYKNVIAPAIVYALEPGYQQEVDLQTEPLFEAEQKDFLNLVNAAKQTCSNKELTKIVLSRVKIKEGNYLDIIPEIFELLCAAYSNAFVFVFNLGTSLWMGASPEPFLLSKDGVIQTTSIAGTKAFSEENMTSSWNRKELEEQAIVTNYISLVLDKFNIRKYHKDGPYSKKAGNVIHLRTDFQFQNQLNPDSFGDFIAEMHPTPAVCGYDKNGAFNFILQNEIHKREFYTGFLGPVNSIKDFSLYVNLRSMKVLADKLALFVGGGVTEGSVAIDEWNETEMKADTLLSILPK